MVRKKIFCQCAAGYCFLQKDAEWAKQNYAKACQPDEVLLDRKLLGILEDQRLHKKNEWMNALGVNGVIQVCCRHQAEHHTS